MALSSGDYFRIVLQWSLQRGGVAQNHFDWMVGSGPDIDESLVLAGFLGFATTEWNLMKNLYSSQTVLETIAIQVYDPALVGKWLGAGDLPINLSGTSPSVEALPAQTAVFWRRNSTVPKAQKKAWLPATGELALQNGQYQPAPVAQFFDWSTNWTSLVNFSGKDFFPKVYSKTNDIFGDLVGGTFVTLEAGTQRRRALIYGV